MNFYVVWEISSRLPVRERIGPFFMRGAAERELDFVSTDPRIKVRNIEIVEEQAQ